MDCGEDVVAEAVVLLVAVGDFGVGIGRMPSRAGAGCFFVETNSPRACLL